MLDVFCEGIRCVFTSSGNDSPPTDGSLPIYCRPVDDARINCYWDCLCPLLVRKNNCLNRINLLSCLHDGSKESDLCFCRNSNGRQLSRVTLFKLCLMHFIVPCILLSSTMFICLRGQPGLLWKPRIRLTSLHRTLRCIPSTSERTHLTYPAHAEL